MTTTLLAYIPSPAQGVWHIGFLPIRAYALCIIAGIIAALVIGDRRWVARGGQPGVIYDIALWAVPFGLIGGRLYHIITDWPTYFGDNGAGFLAALRIWDGGLGIWGAVALGGVGAWIACRRRDIPLPAFGDAIAPGIVLAQAIGRLGNYFNQELWGRATTLPWGLEIFERRDANGALDTLNGVSTGQLVGVVHPTFLYELLWNLLVFALLIWVDRRFKLGHGRLFALYVAAYCVGRFWIELMRSDHATEFGGIRVNSFTSTFVFIGAVIYIMVATKGREDPASLVGKGFDDDEDAKGDVPEKVAAMAGASGAVAAAVVADKDDDAEGTSDASDEPDEAAEPKSDEADGDTEADSESEGLGSVEGDEVAAAVESAPEAHAAAVEETTMAEDLEGDATETAKKADAVDAADGLGSVEGDEVAAAVESAPEAHAAAVEEAVAADGVESEAAVAESADETSDAEDVPEDADEAESADEVEADADDQVDAEEGIGSVEGDEVAAAVDDAAEVHATAVEEAAAAESVESDAAEIADEPDSDADSASEDQVDAEAGLGSVDGDEVAAAVTAAPKIHAATAKGATAAEALDAEVTAEDSDAEDDAESAKDGDAE